MNSQFMYSSPGMEDTPPQKKVFDYRFKNEHNKKEPYTLYCSFFYPS